MANPVEPRSLGIRQPQATPQLRLQNPVLSNQILIPQQQLLIRGPDEYARMRTDIRGCTTYMNVAPLEV
jgi:hypothetical protein